MSVDGVALAPPPLGNPVKEVFCSPDDRAQQISSLEQILSLLARAMDKRRRRVERPGAVAQQAADRPPYSYRRKSLLNQYHRIAHDILADRWAGACMRTAPYVRVCLTRPDSSSSPARTLTSVVCVVCATLLWAKIV